MKKLTLLLLIAISCGFYTGVRAQVNVTSVSEKNDADNFYKMMKEAFPLSFNDPASPRFVFFNKNKNFVFGVGGFVQVQGIYDCLLYTSPSPRDRSVSRMPSSA